jgi:hypothetical protein
MRRKTAYTTMEVIIFGIVWIIFLIVLAITCYGCVHKSVGNAGATFIHESIELEKEIDIIFTNLQNVFIELQTIDEDINALYTIEDIDKRNIVADALTNKLNGISERFASIDFGKLYKRTERIRTLGEELVRWAGGSTMAISDDTYHIVLHELVQDRILRDKQRILGAKIVSKIVGAATGGAGGGLLGEAIASIIAVISSGTAIYKHYKGKKEKQDKIAAEQERDQTSKTLGVVVKAAETLQTDKPKAYAEFKKRVKNERPDDNAEFEAIIAKHKA